jgi:hypothetical protein
MIVSQLKENLLLIGFALVVSTITTLCIGQYVYAIKEQNIHNQIHLPNGIIKTSKHFLHNPIHSPNALGGSSDGSPSGSTAGSPGVLSGNVVQVPVHVPVNVCGNTVNVIGLLNPASGNTCTNS